MEKSKLVKTDLMSWIKDKWAHNPMFSTLLALLVMVLVRAFAPLVILPVADVPNLVLICLVALVLDHYLAPGSKRNYLIAVPLAVVTFGLLPFAAGFATLANMVLMGKLLKECGAVSFENNKETCQQFIKKTNLIDVNCQALQAGYDYE